MSKYIAGPWRVYIPGNSWSRRMDRCRVITETGNAVCEVHAGAKPQNAKERKTAQLIAAAPELLEAVKRLGSLVEPSAKAELDALIAKAEGR